MDFILNEAEVETDSLKFDSDVEDEMECDSTPLSEDEDFLTYNEDEYLRRKILAFIEPLITGKNLQILKIRPRIQLNLLKGLKKIIMVKMICLS